MAKEQLHLNKYNICDKQGYGTKTPDGIFRPLDVVQGNLVYEGSQILEVTKRRAEQVYQQRVRDWRDEVAAHRNGKTGRPRKNSL